MIMKRFISYINRKRSQEAWRQASDLHLRLYQGCHNPPRHQILRIDREEMIDHARHITRQITSFGPKMLVDSDQRI